MRQQLKRHRLTVQDDRGDVNARLKALQDGKAQLAVFTVDSLLTAGARLRTSRPPSCSSWTKAKALTPSWPTGPAWAACRT
jgi:hypothetical protein